MYEEHPEVIRYLDCLIDNVIDVREMSDFVTAFDSDMHKAGGKTIMLWNK